MSKSKGKRDYEREIEEAAKRMKKYPEHLKSARHSSEWKNFLINIGLEPKAVSSPSGSDFWEKVRNQIYTRPAKRRSVYTEAREAGMPAKIARRIRDWGALRAQEAIEKWKSTY